MADLELNVTILDINVSKAAAAFLRKCPIPMIEDHKNPGETIPQYDTTRKWVEAWSANKILRAINHGIDLQAQDLGEKLTSDIFKV